MKGIQYFLVIVSGLLFVLSVGIHIWIFGVMNPWQLNNHDYYETLASFGSVTSPILNFIGTILIFVAFLQQTQSMKESGEEFELQRFESSFFQLINLHRQNIFHIQETFQAKHREESSFFSFIRKRMEIYIGDKNDKLEIKTQYMKLYEEHHYLISHFVRNFLFLLEHIYSSKYFGLANKRKVEIEAERLPYLDILKAQLSTDEAFVLFYDLLIREEEDKKAYIRNLDKESFFAIVKNGLLHPEHLDMFPDFLVEPKNNLS